jgi:hypothetical protein
MTSGSDHDPRFMLKVSLKGFAAAHDRLIPVWRANASVEEIFIPLLAALWWTVTVDDGFENLAITGQSNRSNLGEYRNARDIDADGQAVRALRYARDRCGHQRALMARVRLPTVPLSVPFVLGPVICWRPSAELPRPDPRFDNPALQNEYDRLLAGQFSEAALRSARGWFDQEQFRAEL